MQESTELSHRDALVVIETIRAELERTRQGAAIAVCDPHGELLAFLRTDGCRLPSINIAMGKAFTAAREQIESKTIGERSRSEGFPMTNFGDLRYVSWGGGVPIWSGDTLVGAVGVSGLPEDEDMELAALGAASVG